METALPARYGPVLGRRLRVTTTGGGGMLWAHVYVDGELRGQSPLVLRLRRGRHRLELRRAGFRTITRSIVVRRGVTPIVVPLQRSR